MLNQRKIIFEKFTSIFGNYTLSEAQSRKGYQTNNFEQLLQQETQASWLALPLWGGMGEAVLISSYSRTRIVIEGS